MHIARIAVAVFMTWCAGCKKVKLPDEKIMFPPGTTVRILPDGIWFDRPLGTMVHQGELIGIISDDFAKLNSTCRR